MNPNFWTGSVHQGTLDPTTLHKHQHSDRNIMLWTLYSKLTSGSSSSNSSSNRCSSSSDSFFSSSSSSMSLYFSISFLNVDMVDTTPGNIDNVPSKSFTAIAISWTSCMNYLILWIKMNIIMNINYEFWQWDFTFPEYNPIIILNFL